MGVEITRWIYAVNDDGSFGRLITSDRDVTNLETLAFRACRSEVELKGVKYRILKDRIYNDGEDLVVDVRYERIN